MKKILTLFAFVAIFAGSQAKASTAEYIIDDQAVEAVFESGLQLSAAQLIENISDITDRTEVKADRQPVVAFILATFLGGFAIHRVYLGGSAVLIPAYIFTCFGIFGIVPFVDWIMLLIGLANDDISKYEDNDKFFMWAGGGGK
ncbi:TM2 domain-containing protein [Rhodocytophaga rosea]|uniref:TM2 domain-containing protein n=1 Tax=Rhodocytophaga rosea TaxID=2704465 RepID=A0A6C0GSR6_9BACT|nr:TM2 domain-containing protein [Rhodocytophaga rosea]QHT70510.1 TM2 domain-containing protein [Rhodocytophaga rosea]